MRELSANEKKIMDIIWQQKDKVTAKELMGLLAGQGLNWKIQTVSTFLSRMENKGILVSEMRGHAKLYSPRYSEKGILSYKAKQFIKESFSGSLKNFFVALTDGEISEEKALELEKWLSRQEEK